MMKKSIFLTALLTIAVISMTTAQDLEKILDSHFKAIGHKNLLKVKTMQATGKAEMMGMSNPLTMTRKRPDKIHVIVEYQGGRIIQAYDGENVWMINPMMGSSAPIDVKGPEANGLKESGNMDGQLWKYKEKGHQLELEGSEELAGKEVFVLKLTKKNGFIDHYYIDRESYFIVKVKSKAMMNGSEVDAELLMSNYQEVEGYKMSFKNEQKYGGQSTMTLTLEEVKFNMEVEDALFTKPASN